MSKFSHRHQSSPSPSLSFFHPPLALLLIFLTVRAGTGNSNANVLFLEEILKINQSLLTIILLSMASWKAACSDQETKVFAFFRELVF